MPDRVELFRRIERQHIRDQLSLLGLQSVDGLVLRLLSREGQLRQEDIVLRLVRGKVRGPAGGKRPGSAAGQ